LDRINSKPNLFIVGAAKSGTTSLHNYLKQHPDVFMCTPKEPHFLINNEIGKDRIPVGICSEKQYLNLFLNGKERKYRGESSVMYLMFPEIVIPKINKSFGEDCKIIIMLRNPTERAYSGFQHVKRNNIKEKYQTFISAWDASDERYFSNSAMPPASRYKELGLYYNQVKSYLYGMKNVHIILYDDYQNDFQSEMNKLFDFLEIKRLKINSKHKHMIGGWQWTDERIRNLILNKNFVKSLLKVLIPFKGLRQKIRVEIKNRNTSQVPEISNDDRDVLNRFYKRDVEQLSVLLDRNLNDWTE
jgi:hypothetical protein